jgi:hypothetical protein
MAQPDIESTTTQRDEDESEGGDEDLVVIRAGWGGHGDLVSDRRPRIRTATRLGVRVEYTPRGIKLVRVPKN